MFPVAILAGGLATRLHPLTTSVPKALLEIRGEPFIAHQLRLLRRRGVEQVVLCIGHLGNLIRDFVGSGCQFGLTVRYSEDGPTLLGTAGAIQRAIPLLGETFFVLYGDSYLPCDYAEVAETFDQSKKQALMTVYRNEGEFDASNVEFEKGKILAYSKTARTPEMKFIDYGLGAFHSSAFGVLDGKGPYDLANLYRELLNRGQLAGYEAQHRFYEIGSRAGIDDLSSYLARQQ
jgi:N-acetyl-alpha-D-muramate 1-phosphate uridylyltransferase